MPTSQRGTPSRPKLAERETRQRAKIRAAQQTAGGTRGGEITGAIPALFLPTSEPIVSFYVIGHPAAQGSKVPEGSTRTQTGKVITRLVEQNAVGPWRDEIRLTLKEILKRRPGWTALTCPVFLHMVFSMPHTDASRKRGDLWYTNTPDLDKVMRAFGDALSIPPVPAAIGSKMPPNKKKRVRDEYRANQARLSLLDDDRQIVGALPLQMYAGSPGALPYPGVACSVYPAPDEFGLQQIVDSQLSRAEGH